MTIAHRPMTKSDWDQITTARIDQVYSGKQGCMCGCLGKYFKSGRMVTKVVNILKADPRTMLQDGYIVYIDFPRAKRDERSYVLYLKEDQKLCLEPTP